MFNLLTSAMTIANRGLFYNNRNFNPQYVSLELKNLFMVLTLVQEQIHLSEGKKKKKKKNSVWQQLQSQSDLGFTRY